MTKDFWDQVWDGFDPVKLDPGAYREAAGPSNRMFLELLGDVGGMRVLDLGCGNGLLSVYLAKSGAQVTAIDDSSTAVENTLKLARLNEVDPLIEVQRLDARELGGIGKVFDLAVGSFILHHLEPFGEFAAMLARVISPHGRGVFLENSANNPVLMFFRNHLVGRFGVPKHGDQEEHPFDAGEMEVLKKSFSEVRVYYPEFMFFGLVGSYLFKEKEAAMKIFDGMDMMVYRHMPFLRRYSYRQIIELFP